MLKKNIGIIGLGFVGLPLSVVISNSKANFNVIGFEKNNSCPICRCPHDSCFNGERELGLDLLEQNKNAVNLLKIRDDLILAHSNKRQQPFGHGMRHWGHNGGDFVFIAKK